MMEQSQAGQADAPSCIYSDCRNITIPGYHLCAIHEAHERWLDNSDVNNLGIVQFSHELFPGRINSGYGVPLMHKEIYLDILSACSQGETKMDRLHVIAAPREHSKSTIICFVFTLYCILFQLKHFIVLITESEGKTLQFIRAIKRALVSPGVREYFGDISARNLTHEGGKWAESHIITSTGITIMALGMHKSTRGLIEDERPDLIIADDIESEENTKTDASRQSNWDWWRKAVVPSADIIHGQCIYIGTMVHYDCILARLFDQENNYRKHFYQVWKNEKERIPLWPEKFTSKLIDEIKRDYVADPERGLDHFYAEYYNVAVAPESQRFPVRDSQIIDFEYFTDPTGKWVKLDGKYYNCTSFIGVDPAISEKEWAAFTVILHIVVLYDGRILINKYDRGRYDIRSDNERDRLGSVDQTVKMIQEVLPDRCAIEVSGIGLPVFNEIRRDVIKLKMQRAPMLIEVNPPQDKDKNTKIISVLESPFRQDKIFWRRGMVELENELMQFPKSRYRDILDALYNAVSIHYPPYVEIPYSRERIILEKQHYHTKKSLVHDWELP